MVWSKPRVLIPQFSTSSVELGSPRFATTVADLNSSLANFAEARAGSGMTYHPADLFFATENSFTRLITPGHSVAATLRSVSAG
jgi:hypothetical protein